ncbi:MAG: hypothetical protein IPK68_08875 [Bdellovibrionales bacterium]|nr:hypothetical protein [Bdellovibrionales bacterium]
MNSPVRITSIEESKAASQGNLIAVAFPKSSSRNYRAMVELAQKAQSYCEATLGDKVFHCAVFGRDRTQASTAVMVVAAVQDWKGTQIFVNGRPLERFYNVEKTLRCYLDSLDAIETKAHCHFIYTDVADDISMMKITRNGKYHVPCRMLEGFVREVVRNPISGPEADIQAASIRRGCFWCPNFNPKEFRQTSGREEFNLGGKTLLQMITGRKR